MECSVQVVPDMLSNGVTRYSDRVCVAEGGRSHTFAETSARASQLASALRVHGLNPGDRVALLAMNELEYTEIQVACQRAQLTLVPFNFRLAVPELRYLMGDAQPAALIHGPGFEGVASELDCKQTIHLGPEGCGDSYEAFLESAPVSLAQTRTQAPSSLEPSAPAVILYTSGTTGRPKGAVLSNLALWARMTSFAVDVGMGSDSTFLQCLPLFHIASNLGYGFTFAAGTNVFVKAFSPEAVFEHLEVSRPTHVLMVPTMINMVLNHPDVASSDWSCVQQVIYGASSIAPDVLRQAIDVMGCGFLQMYGMTETGAALILRPEDHDPVGHPEWLAAAGTDAINMATIIVDDQDHEVGPGTVGEIVTRGPCVMSSYWQNEEASNEALRNGWMHTGDAGYRSDDGYVFVTDRIKDMIVSGGENIYPREVEDVLFAHEAVLEAAVIGVPDDRWGERVHAVVVFHPGSEIPEQDLLEYCREHLAGYKVPRSVETAPELPKNATGKVLKTELRTPHWHDRQRGIN